MSHISTVPGVLCSTFLTLALGLLWSSQVLAEPDRSVTVMNVAPTVFASGAEVSMDVQITNIGSDPSNPTTLGFYLSADSTLSTSDTLITSLGLPAIMAGSSLGTPLFGSVSGAPGTYWVGACVDPDPADLATFNDCSAATEVTIPDYDLFMLPVTPGSNRFPSGTSISFSTGVDNRGSESAPGSTLRYKISANSSITFSDSDITTKPVPALDAGERWLDDTSAAVNFSPGNYWIGACVDAVTAETSTSNNCSSGVQVEVLSDQLPDLIISQASANPNSWNLGEFTDLFAVVRNQGTDDSLATTIRFFLSSDASISLSDILLGTDNVTPLEPGATVETGVFVDPQPAPGNYWIGACVITDGLEFQTGNNCSSAVPVTVTNNTNSCTDLPLTCGATVSSSLSGSDCDDSPRGTGFYAKKHTFSANSGDQVTLNAEWSGDGYLYLVNPSGAVFAQNDDLDSNVLASRINATLNSTGTWTVWSTTSQASISLNFDLSLTCAAAPAADLVVLSPGAEPASLFPGESVTVSATVKNNGNNTSATTTARFRWSSDSTIDDGDSLLANQAVGTLGPGAESPVQQPFGVPLDLGTFWTGVCVDAPDGEQATGNNCSSSVQVLVEENTNSCTQLANACGSTVQSELSRTDCDNSPRGTGFFARQHNFSATAGDLVEIDANWTGDGYLYLVNSMGAVLAQNDNDGGANSSRIEFSIPGSGDYSVWATTAAPAQSMDYDVMVACTSQPDFDLTVETPDISPLTLDFGDPLQVAANVNNGGPGSSSPTTLRILLSLDSTISAADSDIRSFAVPVISESGTEHFAATLTALYEPGKYWIGACVDSPAGETNSANNCSAGVEITIEGGDGIPINAGLNDAWFNPDTNGQGFFINVFPDIGRVFFAWFTYDTERPDAGVTANLGGPGQRWLTAFGEFQDNVAVLDIEITSGGVFNAGEPAPDQQPDGTLVLRMSSCSQGSVEFDIPSIGMQGVVPMQRIASDNVALCESLVEPAAAVASEGDKTAGSQVERGGNQTEEHGFEMNAGLNDAWFNPATNGQGFFVNVFPQIGKMFLAWFTYDTERPGNSVESNLGDPGHRWMTAFGDFAGHEAVLDIEKTTGGVFNASEPAPVQVPDGTITVDFEDCSNGTISFDITSINQQGEVPIQRIALDNVALCEELDAMGAAIR